MSPERLWRLSAALYRRGLRPLAFFVKKVNSAIYHNSLPPDVDFSPDVHFGHHGFGTVIHSNVTIGRGVRIAHNVTISVRAGTGSPSRITLADGVRVGANSVILAPKGKSVTIGRGARIGAGALVTGDVPPGATVVNTPSRILPPRGLRTTPGAGTDGSPGEEEEEELEAGLED